MSHLLCRHYHFSGWTASPSPRDGAGFVSLKEYVPLAVQALSFSGGAASPSPRDGAGNVKSSG